MAGRMIGGAAALADLVRPGAAVDEGGMHRVLPVLPDLGSLLPGHGLRRGTTVAIGFASGAGPRSSDYGWTPAPPTELLTLPPTALRMAPPTTPPTALRMAPPTALHMAPPTTLPTALRMAPPTALRLALRMALRLALRLALLTILRMGARMALRLAPLAASPTVLREAPLMALLVVLRVTLLSVPLMGLPVGLGAGRGPRRVLGVGCVWGLVGRVPRRGDGGWLGGSGRGAGERGRAGRGRAGRGRWYLLASGSALGCFSGRVLVCGGRRTGAGCACRRREWGGARSAGVGAASRS
ncbi:hypothetical protein Asp14428_25560 [Actinoplanes sp. NBRC 14428]|nr:hypothetical protein Asp14428_25560 [Actinoplanes sp. NBRC 14428]